MSHFAQIGLNLKVLKVLVVDNDVITDGDGNEVEQLGIDYLQALTGYPFWYQTSYNGNIRKNYAGVGYRYDDDLDAFIPPKHFSSWSLNETSCQWEAPISMPDDGENYTWDEEIQNWSILAEQQAEMNQE